MLSGATLACQTFIQLDAPHLDGGAGTVHAQGQEAIGDGVWHYSTFSYVASKISGLHG